MRPLFVLVLISLLAISTGLFGATPFLLNYHGRLSDNAGVPLDGVYQISFTIYDIEMGGTALWTETHAAVNVNKGLFAVILGSISPIAPGLFVTTPRYLAISVNGGPELSPRQQLVSAAFSFHSFDSDLLEGEPASHYHSWTNLTDMPAGFADGVDDVGIGDITAIDAVNGLDGGGASGAVKIGIDSNGVTTGHVADGTIMNADINASGAIAVGKISGTAVNLSSSQIVTGAKTFTGEFYLGDSTFHSSSSGITVGTDAYQPTSTYLMSLNRTYSTTLARYGLYCDIDNYSTGTVYGLCAVAPRGQPPVRRTLATCTAFMAPPSRMAITAMAVISPAARVRRLSLAELQPESTPKLNMVASVGESMYQ